MKIISERELEKLKQGDTEPLADIFQAIYQHCVDQVYYLSDCPSHDAEDLVMDSLFVLREKVMHDEYQNQNVQSFVISVALNKWKNRRRKYNRTVFVDSEELGRLKNEKTIDDSSLESLMEKENQAIRIALERSEGKCGQLLRKNLYDGIALEILMAELGYSSYAVIKSTKSRCMKKLRLAIASLLNENHG